MLFKSNFIVDEGSFEETVWMLTEYWAFEKMFN